MGYGTSRRSLLSALGAAAVGISFTGLEACSKPGAKGGPASGEEPKLNFYNWDTYIGDTTLSDFKKVSGIDVNMTLFASNDELFAKLKAGNPGFDVIVPSNDYVPRLRDAGLLMALDHGKIPNIRNIDASFMNPVYDPGRKYSLPYTWLALGLGYRKSKMQPGHIPDSWSYVFEPTMHKKRITILGDSADLIRLAGKYLGYPLNDTVVIYDRIRENLRKYRKMAIIPLINFSLNETLSRTIVTSLSILIALAALIFLGPEVIFGLTVAVFLGIFIGTYSSIYISSPILVWLGVTPDSFLKTEDDGADKTAAKPA